MISESSSSNLFYINRPNTNLRNVDASKTNRSNSQKYQNFIKSPNPLPESQPTSTYYNRDVRPSNLKKLGTAVDFQKSYKSNRGFSDVGPNSRNYGHGPPRRRLRSSLSEENSYRRSSQCESRQDAFHEKVKDQRMYNVRNEPIIQEQPRRLKSILHRAETAPEDFEVQRVADAEWRRTNFGRSGSRPSSIGDSKTLFPAPPSFLGDCSASCPPTVPTTPTRSSRSNYGEGLSLPPPPFPRRSRTPDPSHSRKNSVYKHPMERLNLSGPLPGAGFQCECMEDRKKWQWEPGVFDMWCAPCSKKRTGPERWSSFDLNSTYHRTSSTGLLSAIQSDRNPPWGDRFNTSALSLAGSKISLNETLAQGPPPRPSIWDCLVMCHGNMGAMLAKKRMEQGLALYSEQKHVLAVKKWQLALRRYQKTKDRFITLGYIAQAHMNWGGFRELLDYGFQQLDIANDLDSPALRAEAYLTIAKGQEKLGHLDKAISYCRNSLYYQCDQSKVTGYVHYTLGNVYSMYSAFSKALEHYELSLKVAKVIRETELEVQVYYGLSLLFCYLQDFEKSLSLATKVTEIAKTFTSLELSSKYQRMAHISLATPLRKLSRCQEARDFCQDAMKLSLAAHDYPSYSKCLLILADVHRQCLDVQRSYKYYDGCMKLMKKIGDQYGQIMVLNGVAKVLGLMRKQSRICDCKPLEINNKVVDLASEIGCKLFMRSAHNRLAEIYRILCDDQNEIFQVRLSDCLSEEMQLFCEVCQMPYGDVPGNSLESLPCSHIFHAKCIREIAPALGDRKRKRRNCPACHHKSVNSNPIRYPCCDDNPDAYIVGIAADECIPQHMNCVDAPTTDALLGVDQTRRNSNFVRPNSNFYSRDRDYFSSDRDFGCPDSDFDSRNQDFFQEEPANIHLLDANYLSRDTTLTHHDSRILDSDGYGRPSPLEHSI